MSNNQTQSILEYLKKGNSLTPLDSLHIFGCFRLGARIFDIKKMGFNIKTEMVIEGKKHFAKYSLETMKIESNGQLLLI